MAIDEKELAEAQAYIQEKRREHGIPECVSPKQEQSPVTRDIGPTALEIVETARTHALALDKINPGCDPMTRISALSKIRHAKTKQAGKSWGPLYIDLLASPEFIILKRRELVVALTLIASRDSKSGESAPGRKKIEALTRFAPRTIDRALTQLINRGIIQQTRSAHVGRNATFIVAENSDDIARNLEMKERH